MFSVPAQCLRRNQYLESSSVRLICKSLKKIKIRLFLQGKDLAMCFQKEKKVVFSMHQSEVFLLHGMDCLFTELGYCKVW